MDGVCFQSILSLGLDFWLLDFLSLHVAVPKIDHFPGLSHRLLVGRRSCFEFVGDWDS